MLLPGYADYVDLSGYLIETCSECHQRSVFAVYEARRKLTITFIPTPVNIKQLRVMECKTCGARFGVPKAWEADLPRRLMTQDQLSARVRELRGSSVWNGPYQPGQQRVGSDRTAYQVLQVDPMADQDVIEAAFKRLALKSHPDHHDGAEAGERMRELAAAREMLQTPERRLAYDRSIGLVRPADSYRADATSSRRHARQDAAPQRGGQDASPANRHSSPPPHERSEPVALPPSGPRPKGIRADEV